MLDDISKHSPKQLDCFKSAKSYIDGEKGPKQMFMFISGAGGCGKSKLIKAISEYTRLAVGRTRGSTGPAGIWTPTGCAGFAVGGITWQSALGLSMYHDDESISSKAK